jgi:hypothetical protein
MGTLQETNKIFREQIEEDIKLIQEEIIWDKNIQKPEYAFNYWILSNLYHLEISTCGSNITEYSDKGIDCFVHFEEDKELYIIQNKYYSDDTKLSSKEVSDFITRPLASLEKGNYKSEELQGIYNKIRNDDSYKIFLHFYVTNNHINEDIKNLEENIDGTNFIFALHDLDTIKEKYYGKSFKETQTFNFTFSNKNKGTFLAIRPVEYDLPNLKTTFYIMAKVSDVYDLLKTANEKQYSLFEQNIREYLGRSSGINKGIMRTLRDKSERNNFFYYNNGITIIVKSAKAERDIRVENPQIVNGCQTVNSIFEVLKHDNPDNYNDVYVMVKILVIENTNDDFYRDVVKYNNSQNAINEKVFGATLEPFFRIQKELKQYGILLNVKQSDKYQNKLIENKTLNELITNANDNSNFFEFNTTNDIQINLETLLQIIGAFTKDAYYAYAKKSFLLKPTSKEYYEGFSIKIANTFTIESMAKLVNIYKKAYQDQQASQDRKTPAPFYLLNMIGYFLSKHNIDKQSFLKEVEYDDLKIIYETFKSLPSNYYKKFYKKHNQTEYNQMLKKEVDTDIFDEIIDDFKDLNYEKYNQIYDIVDKIKKSK